MAETPRLPFSKRYGYKQPKEISVCEDAPERVRRTAVDKARSPIGPERLLEIVGSVLKLQPARTDNAWNQVERLMSSCEWFRVNRQSYQTGIQISEKDVEKLNLEKSKFQVSGTTVFFHE